MEGSDSLTAKSWLSSGWSTFKAFPLKLVLGGLLMFLVNVAPPKLFGAIEMRGWGVALHLGVFAGWFLVSSAMWIGWQFFCLRLAREPDVPFSAIFGGFSRFATAVWLTLCYGVIMGLGLILLVVPGIAWFIKYSLSPYAMMDRQFRAMEAIKFSGKITTGYKWKLFAVHLVWLAPVGLPMILDYLGSSYQNSSYIYVGTVVTLAEYCVLYPWVCCSLAVAYDRCSIAYGRQGQALMNAASNNDFQQVQDLLDKGSDVNAKNSDGLTALMLASKSGHSEIVELLKAHGAKE